MKNKSNKSKPKKPIFKRWWFWVLIVFVILVGIGSGGTKDGSNDAVKDSTSAASSASSEEASAEPTAEPTAEPVSESTSEATKASESSESATSDSTSDTNDLDSIVSFNVKDVRNDVTGKWRISVIAESIDMTDYALDYYKEYFKSDDEIHAIVNFTYNTTTKISVVGNYLDVSVYEYVDKEEHDAKILFSGMLLGDSLVDMETGEIQKIQ